MNKFRIKLIISSIVATAFIFPTAYSQDNDFGTYVVKAQDTLYSISKSVCVSMRALQSENGIADYNISLGQVLKIPLSEGHCYVSSDESNPEKNNSQITEVAPVTVPNRQTEVVEFKDVTRTKSQGTILVSEGEYIVVTRDTLYSISRGACTSVQELMRVNNIVHHDAPKVGMSLYLPVDNCLTDGSAYKPIKSELDLTLEQKQAELERERVRIAVSYTHLTLPTKA